MRDAAQNNVGLLSTVSMVIGSIIGAGIFLLPVSLAPLGWNATVGWMVSSAGALCLAFALSRLALRGDGIQAHIQEIFGAAPAFVAAWSFWFATSTANGALAIAAASALSRINPHLGASAVVTPLAVTFTLLLTAVNAFGIRAAGRMQILTTLIKVVPLLAVILLLTLREFRSEPVQSLSATPLTIGGIAAAAALTLFALTGFENVTAPVKKIRNSSHTLPLAMIGGTAFVALLYVLSSTAVSLLLGPAAVANSPAPFADALTIEWGGTAVQIAAVCIAVSAFGCVNAGILAAGELAYAMARNGDLPEILARTRSDGTPVFSHCFAGALGVGLILLNANRSTASLFTFIVLVSTVGTLLMYVIGSVGAFVRSIRRWERLIMGGGILFALFAFYGAGFEASAWGVLLVLVGVLVRSATRYANTKRSVAASISVRSNQSMERTADRRTSYFP